MSLDELALILCDMYEMDEWLPNPVFDKKEFTRVSNTLWAIGEFRNYVADHIFSQTQTSIKNLEAMAQSFTEKMDDFASMNQQNLKYFIITLTANVVFPYAGDSKVYAHEVVVRPLENGRVQYVSNRIIPSEDNYRETWHTPRLTLEEWEELYGGE